MDRILYEPASAGEILKDYMGEQSTVELANELGISRVSLSRILNGHKRLTESMAIKLSRKYKTDPMFWIGISSEYEIWKILKSEEKADI